MDCSHVLSTNTYHRALKLGAVWYCHLCDSHIKNNGDVIPEKAIINHRYFYEKQWGRTLSGIY